MISKATFNYALELQKGIDYVLVRRAWHPTKYEKIQKDTVSIYTHRALFDPERFAPLVASAAGICLN